MTRLKLDYVHEYRDRHGKLRRYFRRPSFKQVALPGPRGSDEFMTAYQLALAGQQLRVEIGAGRAKPGTVNAAIVGYHNSLAFRSDGPGTQKMRRAILEQFRAAHGEKRIAWRHALGTKARLALALLLYTAGANMYAMARLRFVGVAA
jgi:hypothetical protein